MYKGNGEMEKATIAARPTVADEIGRFADELAERIARLADRIEGKLSPITTSSCPSPPLCENAKDNREYPPLFNELRIRFTDIKCALNRIEDTINRVEL